MPECAAGRVRVVAALVLALGSSCGKGVAEQSMSPSKASALAAPVPAQPPAAQAAALPPIAAPAAPAPPELLAGTFMLQQDILRGLSRARLRRVRPVGSTSTVFRSDLDVPFRAAFKLPTQVR